MEPPATLPGYDANGNTTQDDRGQAFVYGAWNRLVQVTAGSNTVVYAYDALGRRLRTTVNSTPATDLYYSSAWQVLEERQNGGPTAQYVWSPGYIDALVERDAGGLRLYVQQDANYNVTAVVNSAGAVQERYVYDPFGQVTALDAVWNVRAGGSQYSWVYLHQGGRFEALVGLYNFRHRDYSPTLGRWLQQDPVVYEAGDANLYGYVGSRPASKMDPSGLAAEDDDTEVLWGTYQGQQIRKKAWANHLNWNVSWGSFLNQTAPTYASDSSQGWWGTDGKGAASRLRIYGKSAVNNCNTPI
jgi:RHS repeat-associated protein